MSDFFAEQPAGASEGGGPGGRPPERASLRPPHTVPSPRPHGGPDTYTVPMKRSWRPVRTGLLVFSDGLAARGRGSGKNRTT